MKITKKKVTREKFILSINAANISIQQHPRTKLAYYCGEFLEINEELIKSNAKEQRKLTEHLNLELRKVRIDNAVEKDGVVILNDEKNYSYGRSGEEAVLKKQDEINEKIEKILEPFLKKDTIVQCIVNELTLPDKLDNKMERQMNGFVFQNKNEFYEEKDFMKE